MIGKVIGKIIGVGAAGLVGIFVGKIWGNQIANGVKSVSNKFKKKNKKEQEQE